MSFTVADSVPSRPSSSAAQKGWKEGRMAAGGEVVADVAVKDDGGGGGGVWVRARGLYAPGGN